MTTSIVDEIADSLIGDDDEDPVVNSHDPSRPIKFYEWYKQRTSQPQSQPDMSRLFTPLYVFYKGHFGAPIDMLSALPGVATLLQAGHATSATVQPYCIVIDKGHTTMLPQLSLSVFKREYVFLHILNGEPFGLWLNNVCASTNIPLGFGMQVTNMIVCRQLEHPVDFRRIGMRARVPQEIRWMQHNHLCHPFRIAKSACTLRDGREHTEYLWAIVFQSGRVLYHGFANAAEGRAFEQLIVEFVWQFAAEHPPSSAIIVEEERVAAKIMQHWHLCVVDQFVDKRPPQPIVQPSFCDWFHDKKDCLVIVERPHDLVIQNVVAVAPMSTPVDQDTSRAFLDNLVDGVMVTSVQYERHRFSGIIVRMPNHVCAIVFSRNVIMTGSPSMDVYHTALEHMRMGTQLPFQPASLCSTNTVAVRRLRHHIDIDAIMRMTPTATLVTRFRRGRAIKLRVLTSATTDINGRDRASGSSAMIFARGCIIYAGTPNEEALRRFDMIVTSYLEMFRLEPIENAEQPAADTVDEIIQEMSDLTIDE